MKRRTVFLKYIHYIFGTCRRPESFGVGRHKNVINNNKTIIIIKEDTINKLQISRQGKRIGK